MIAIQHPAWAHQFRRIISILRRRGDEVMVLAVDKDGSLKLLDSFGIPYTLCARTTGRNVFEKGCLFLGLSVSYTMRALRFRPDVLIGRASPMMAIAAFFCRRPHVIYEDTEVSKFSLNICKRLSRLILTPRTFLTDLGPKQRRVATYKELFYLHPSVFTPSREALDEAGFNSREPYIIVRFVAWNASHDIGLKAPSEKEKLAMIAELEKYGRVYLSCESEASEALSKYLLNTPYELIHHVLAFARLVYSEGATMASEAVVLGTHAVYINPIVSGSTKEQEEKYHLLKCFNTGEDRYMRALDAAREWLSDPELEKKGRVKRDALLGDMTDINSYYIDAMDGEAKRNG